MLAPRPAGRLVWLHQGHALPEAARADLLAALIDSPDTHVLISGADDAPLPAQCFATPMADETAGLALLDHFRPDAALWCGPLAYPRLMARLAADGTPCAAFNITRADLQLRRLRRQLADMLAGFSDVICAEPAAADELHSLGLTGPNIETLGLLRPLDRLPPDQSALRRALSSRLAGRPVWVALGADSASLPALAAAHVKARRSSPGLVMLLVPAPGADADELRAEICAAGLAAAPAKSPAPDMDVLVFSSDAEGGDACRLASVAVLAGSLLPDAPITDPLLPANLGAALIHGPHAAGHGDMLARLAQAQAARALTDPAQLGATLAEVLRPDAAAAMATAAWTMLSEGAEIITRLAAVAHGRSS